MPPAFPFFSLFTAFATSSSVICSMHTSKQVITVVVFEVVYYVRFRTVED